MDAVSWRGRLGWPFAVQVQECAGGVPGFQPAVAVAIVQQIVEFPDDEDRHDEPDPPCGERRVRLAPGHLGPRLGTAATA